MWTATERDRALDQRVLLEVEKLRRANVADLREKYREVFGEETRCRHREHLFRRIAWRLQAPGEGDLSVRARQRAQEIADDANLREIAPADFLHSGRQRHRNYTRRTEPEEAGPPLTHGG